MDEKIKILKQICLTTKSTNPIAIALKMMDEEVISIHGPEHHILDGFALMCAIYNKTHSFDLEKAMDTLIERGLKMPGAMCGYWGVCGSASSIGACLSAIHEVSPLSNNDDYKKQMKLTSQILNNISEIGGPRCCKRNAMISLKSAISFLKENYQIELDNQEYHCYFTEKNKQCIKEQCPFYHK